MQDRSAARARLPHDSPTSAQRGGILEDGLGLGPQLAFHGRECLPDRGQCIGFGLDELAEGGAGVPQLPARQLDGNERGRPGGRAGEGGHVDADARAPRRNEDT